MQNNGEWASLLKKVESASTVKELIAIKTEATITKSLTYRQMDAVCGRCDYAIEQLENPSQKPEYTPNKYDEKRMQLKGLKTAV